ncbi:MAG: DUF2075 domain-containing protein [Bacteroidetes bacterium]|nr:MAG: DUF2075 domain-containing protein [Bacteroidota bacterium]
MTRSYYSNSILGFLQESTDSIFGKLNLNHRHEDDLLQKNAWIGQIKILKEQLKGFNQGHIFFEFAIPRMGKRVDNILILGDTVFVLEFKVGSAAYDKHAIDQVIDYSLDLQNFHEASHHARLIPIVLATNAPRSENDTDKALELRDVLKVNFTNLAEVIRETRIDFSKPIDPELWANSRYKPTPTIIEAAQALYQGHNVEEISRSDAGAINLSKTANCISAIIEDAKRNHKKAICFVTGVPGAGKTLAGLNVANERMKAHEDEHAVFLSGNGPLVTVLREALTRDEVERSKAMGAPLKKADAQKKTFAFIQNIHHFRDDNLGKEEPPIEKVVVFDEAQRAWTKEQASKFMQQKRGFDGFNLSEPAFLIDVMDRHEDWCVVIGLIGGGQEINTGEAGLEEWITALQELYPDWEVHYSELIANNDNYLSNPVLKQWLSQHATSETNLHLGVSVRSFRSERLAYFVHALLELDLDAARETYAHIKSAYPVVMTRDLEKAKNWVREQAKGTERFGLVASSGARRLRPLGIDVKNTIDAAYWFLNDSSDIRSSYYMEDVATEFDIQGLEIDWVCLAWGANFHIKDGEWQYLNFSGTKWQQIRQDIQRQYLKNTYRVLLTRARQGMVIYLPKGDEIDPTRPAEYYDGTYNYFKEIGIEEI